ncbi:hypothetical protein HK101_008329 [Irineochytrium annulatum]|nr:hypothetical protein HK101_008329 [Irineochytrium annulatum]
MAGVASALAAVALVADVAGVDATTYVTTPCTQLKKVNAYRASKGSPPLTLDRRLVASAQAHTNDMAVNMVMIHDSTDGTSWGSRVSSYYPDYHYLAENVAEFSTNETQIMLVWIASPEHEANLRDPRWAHFGSGYVGSYWTQDFGLNWPNDVTFPIDCTKEDGFAWPQPALAKSPYTGTIVTSEGLCMDVSSSNTMVANACVANKATQKFTLTQAGAGFTIKIAGTNKCVDVFNQATFNGAPVGIVTCTGKMNEIFMQNPQGGWIAMHSGKCLDLPGGGLVHAAGTPFDQWTCNGGSNQALTAQRPIAGASQYYNFVASLTTPDNLCLDGSAGAGQSVKATTCVRGNAGQSWTIKQSGGGFVLQVTGTNNCLDVMGSNPNNGAQLNVYTCGNALNQAFQFTSSNGLQNLGSTKCVTLNSTPHTSGMKPVQ